MEYVDKWHDESYNMPHGMICDTPEAIGGATEVPSKKESVLVVDDDTHTLRMIQRIMELEGYHILTVSNGKAALDLVDEQSPDLVLLDVVMPMTDGYTVCRHIREFSQVPIIMVTAKGNEEQKVTGLDAGADDYITKPFSASELTARVRAVLRRTNVKHKHPETVFRCADLTIDLGQRKVTLADEEIDLTYTEYKMLSYLAQNAGRVVTPDSILSNVWGEEYLGDTHLLQVNIARLRQKLKDNAKNPMYIVTKPGMGYTMLKPT